MDPSEVPYEMLETIFSFLNVYDLLGAAHTCSRWNEVVSSSEGLWRRQLAKLGVPRSPEHAVEEDLSAKITRLKAKAAAAHHKEEVMGRWLSGQYSNLTYEDYCRSAEKAEKGQFALSRRGHSTFICKMSCEDWGRILDAEMQRT